MATLSMWHIVDNNICRSAIKKETHCCVCLPIMVGGKHHMLHYTYISDLFPLGLIPASSYKFLSSFCRTSAHNHPY
jgi:hypothetical protein